MGRGGCKAAGMTAYDRGGGSSRSDAAGRLEAARYRKGEIPVSCINETTVPGLFAAGDVSDVPEKQILIAAGEGAKAVLTAHRYLQHLEIEVKV